LKSGVTATAVQDGKRFPHIARIRASVLECGDNPESFRETRFSFTSEKFGIIPGPPRRDSL